MTNVQAACGRGLGWGEEAAAFGQFHFQTNIRAGQSITKWPARSPQNKHNKFAIKRLNCANGSPMRRCRAAAVELVKWSPLKWPQWTCQQSRAGQSRAGGAEQHPGRSPPSGNEINERCKNKQWKGTQGKATNERERDTKRESGRTWV